MQWTRDVAAGEWLRERLDSSWQPPFSMHMVVPRGFEAYARIFHPVARERPIGRAWPPLPHEEHKAAWAAFASAWPEIDTEHVRWSEVARTFGTRLHPDSRWGRLVGHTEPYNNAEPQDAAGWRYLGPQEGRLDPETLATAAALLAAHTSTPDAGYVAVWEGWGGMLGGMISQSASFPSASAEDMVGGEATYTSHAELLARSIHNPWNDGYAKPRWVSGILSDEISRGPRLALPNRDHVLFSGGIAEFTDAQWPERAPWLKPASTMLPESPSLIWPDDRAWVFATEIDYDSTVVAGSAALVEAICANPQLEALPIAAETALNWTNDVAG